MMSSTAATPGNSMQQGYALSVMLHVAVIAMAWMGIPLLQRELPEESSLIIDLVPIAAITAAAPRPALKPESEIEPAPQTPEPVEVEAPPLLEKIAPTPKKVTGVLPSQVKPQPKPKPPPTKEEEIAFLNKLLKDLDEKDTVTPRPPAQTAVNQQPSNNFARTSSDAPTMSELDAIVRHIEDHWRIDPGKEGVDELTVEVKINVSADGTVQQAHIVDSPRYFLDTTFRTFANSARNAVLAASPLPINPSNASAFREMTLVFSPQGRIN